MGIYALIQCISLLQPFGMFVTTYSKLIDKDINLPLMYLAALLPSFVLLIMAFVLIFLSGQIANKLNVPNQPNDHLNKISTKAIQSLAFSIIGVVISILAFIQIIRHGSNILFAFQSVKEPSQLLSLPHAIGILFQLFLGVALFFSAKPLSLFWHRLKYEWGSNKIDET
jgi:hypothetical protein